MKILRCYIENFGKLHNFTYEFKDGLNIILEENGFGKTTFAMFIKAMLYGLDSGTNVKIENSERKKYMPWQGGLYGGNLEIQLEEKKYKIERFFGKKQSDDIFKIYDLSTNLETSDYTENIGEEIFKINKIAYERSTFIPQNKVQIEMEDTLSAKLGNILEGDNDINTSEDAIKRLNNEKKIYKKDKGKGGLIDEKKELLKKLERELENGKSDTENLAIKKQRLDDKLKDLHEAEELRKKAEDAISKKIEFDRKKAKQETYKSIVERYIRHEEELRELENFLNSGITESFNKKNITDKTIDETIKNCYELPELEQEINLNINKKENLQNRIKTIKLISLLVTSLVIILSAVSMLFTIPKIIGIVGIICSIFILIIFTLILNKNKKNTTTEINKNIENLKKNKTALESQIKYLIDDDKYSSDIIVKLTDLKSEYNLMQIKRSKYDNVKSQYEISKSEKIKFENENDINELQSIEAEIDISEEDLRESIFELNKKIDLLIDEKNQLKNDIEILENKIEDNDLLESDIEKVKNEIDNFTNKYKILYKTEELLKTAKNNFSATYLKDMTDGFKKYLKIINNKELDTKVDINLDVTVDMSGSQKEIKYFSAGYKDLIYLCMRFSLIKALFKNENPFVVLDDPFVNLDDEKTKKALEVLNEFAKQYQIIYFVCNSSRR